MSTVCILTNVHGPYDTRIFHKQAKTLQAVGHDVSILAPIDESQTRDSIDVIPLGNYDSRAERWSNLYRVYQTAKSADADIYHLHDPELLPVGVALSKASGGEVVYDVHEDFSVAVKHRQWIPSAATPLISGSISGIQTRLAQYVDAIVTATEWIAEPFEKSGHPKCRVIRNFPQIHDVDPNSGEIDFEQEHMLAYVGGLSDKRGLSRMLLITKRLIDEGFDIGLCLVGPFTEQTAEKHTSEFIEQNGLEDRILLTGYVDYEDIFGYLSAADIGLILADPSRYEYVISTKMFEYLYAELPVVATATESMSKYLPPEAGIMVNGTDVEEQTQVIKQLLTDEDRRESMGRAGRAAVEEKYSWSIEKERLLRLYEELA